MAQREETCLPRWCCWWQRINSYTEFSMLIILFNFSVALIKKIEGIFWLSFNYIKLKTFPKSN